jgi:methanogenic corrinoid protein MtbC1
MVGGGAINADFAKSIGADGYGETAAEGVTLAKALMKG